MLTSGFASSASRTCNAARARTGFGTIPPLPIWVLETQRSSHTPPSASGSTITTWFRTRRPPRRPGVGSGSGLRQARGRDGDDQSELAPDPTARRTQQRLDLSHRPVSLDAPAEICPATLWRLKENGVCPAGLSRLAGENSNGAIVNTRRRSKLLQRTGPQRLKSSPSPTLPISASPRTPARSA